MFIELSWLSKIVSKDSNWVNQYSCAFARFAVFPIPLLFKILLPSQSILIILNAAHNIPKLYTCHSSPQMLRWSLHHDLAAPWYKCACDGWWPPLIFIIQQLEPVNGISDLWREPARVAETLCFRIQLG